MVFPTHRFRRIGAYIGTAGLLISGSYVLAIYADSKTRKLHSNFSQLSPFGQKRAIHYPESDDLLESVRKFWKQSRESQKTIYSLIAANSIVFIAWRIPSFSLILNRYFLHSINSHPASMLGSIFSHKSLLHLSFNMIALNSFGSFLHEKMGREQFLAFYISSGMSSSLVSHVYKSFRWNFTPSLGASGAIFGIVGGCAHYPDLKVSLIFLPIHSIPISQALPAMVGIDVLGMIFDWKVFDHAAHLGGALFGYLFYPFMVKRGASGAFSNQVDSDPNKYAETYLVKPFSLLGVGIIGSAVFQYDKFPLLFYISCVTLSFILYTLSISQLSYLSQSAKLSSIVGVAALNGPACTFFTVFSIFSALISISAVLFSLAIYLTKEMMMKNFLFTPKPWATSITYGLIFLLIICFVKRCDVSYSWARYSFVGIFCMMGLLNVISNFDDVSKSISQNLSVPFTPSLSAFYEALTVIGVSLLSLFCVAASDPNTLKNKKTLEASESPTFSRLILCNSIGLLMNLSVLVLLKNQIVSIFFSDSLISNSNVRAIIDILLISSILIQSFEYFDRSHNLIYDFFKPLAEESLKTVNSIYLREFLLSGLVFSISYFIGSSIETSVEAMSYILCLFLSIPFMVLPTAYMISKYRKSDEGVGIFYWLSCSFTSCSGTILTVSNIFGIASIQDDFIYPEMIFIAKEFAVLIILSCLIYMICLILDVMIYRPQIVLPLRHRTLSGSELESVTYGKSYISEIIIAVCMLVTFTPSIVFYAISLRSHGSGTFYENAFKIAGDYLLRLFIHADVMHFLMNSLCMLPLGRRISTEIGPFHYIAFFTVSGLFASFVANIIYIHSDLMRIRGIGASGAIFALLAKDIFGSSNIYSFMFAPVSGHEFFLYTVLSCTIFILTGLISDISHQAHLAGFIFGIIFWNKSIDLWTIRGKLHRKLFSQS